MNKYKVPKNKIIVISNNKYNKFSQRNRSIEQNYWRRRIKDTHREKAP